MKNKFNLLTAISIMAVMFIGISMSGCVTSRHIDELKAEIRDIKEQNDATVQAITEMEKVVTENTESVNKLRNDVTLSNDQLQERIDVLLENYNELMRIMLEIRNSLATRHVITSSPGSQTESDITSKGIDVNKQTPISQPTEYCIDSYDAAFILARREKYDEAIEAFNKYLTNCPDHESVENAHYWIGECFYSLEKYVDASEKFDFLINNFKSSVNLSRAMYKLARCHQELGKTDAAKDLFNRLINDFPETLEANQAKERLKDL
jgi:tol-pal system protein YbgF